jgi:hypothetical protein
MRCVISMTALLLLFAGPAAAQVVTITKIADATTTPPGAPLSVTYPLGVPFGAFGIPSMDGSTVAFYGADIVPNGDPNQPRGPSGIYTVANGALSALALNGAPIPNGIGTFASVQGTRGAIAI